MAQVRKLVLIGDTLLSLYRRMAIARGSEEQAAELIRRQRLPVSVGPRYGLEAIGAGVGWHLQPDDLFLGPNYAHGLALAKGVEARDLWRAWLALPSHQAGLTARAAAADPPRARLRFDASGYVSAGANAAAAVRHATGAALGLRQQQSNRVAAVLFPAHVIGSGACHESLLVARQHALPVVYLCDHPLPYDAPPSQRLAMRIRAYGMPCVFIDGSDLGEVYAAANDAVARARREGPTFIECATQCLDPARYSTAEQEREAIGNWAPRDPLALMHAALLEHGQPEAKLKSIQAHAREEIKALIQGHLGSGGEASRSAPPAPAATKLT